MEETRYALTTVDNPYNPWTQYDEWREYDEIEKGYNTSSLLARITNYSTLVSDDQSLFDLNLAIDSIIELMPDLYKKVPASA